MSLPGTLIKDRLKMQATFLLTRMVGFASLIYLTLATCEIFGWQKIKKIYPPLIILFGILPLIFALFTMTPAKIKIIAGKNFIYYLTSEDPMILNLIFFLIVANLSIVAVIFLHQGLKSKEKFIRQKAILPTGGGLLLA